MEPRDTAAGGRAVSLADLVTAGNAVCGFLAIALVVADAGTEPGGGLPEQTVIVAAILVIAGGLLDSVDGAVARWRGSSGLGEHLETMSDVVTFGCAPAVLFAVDARAYAAPWDTLCLAVGAGYLVAALLRLARYATSREGDDHVLVGFPSPPAAMAALSIVVLHPPPLVALLAFLALAALMLGSFPFPTIRGWIVPFMAGWWVFAAVAAAGLVEPSVLAVFTLAVLTTVLASVPLRSRPGAPPARPRA